VALWKWKLTLPDRTQRRLSPHRGSEPVRQCGESLERAERKGELRRRESEGPSTSSGQGFFATCAGDGASCVALVPSEGGERLFLPWAIRRYDAACYWPVASATQVGVTTTPSQTSLPSGRDVQGRVKLSGFTRKQRTGNTRCARLGVMHPSEHTRNRSKQNLASIVGHQNSATKMRRFWLRALGTAKNVRDRGPGWIVMRCSP